MNSEDFTGYVLAGGKSSRMKQDKAFLKIGEKTFIENAAEHLAPVCKQVKVVLNKSQDHFIEKIPAEIPHIFDIYENRGALGGIHAAFRDCETKFAVVSAIDLPFVSSEAFEKLGRIKIEKDDAAAVVPKQRDGKLQPLAAIYDVEKCAPEIEEIMSEKGSHSVRYFLDKISIIIVEQKDLSDDTELFFNVNNQTDLRQIKKGA